MHREANLILCRSKFDSDHIEALRVLTWSIKKSSHVMGKVLCDGNL